MDAPSSLTNNESASFITRDNIAIEVQNLTIAYRKRIALKNINGIIEKGSLTAIIGPNGGGKSTFLKALMKLVPYVEGHISYPYLSSAEVAYLPQNSEIDQSFPISVFDLVASGHVPHRGFFQAFTEQNEEQIYRALEFVDLKDYAQTSIASLSGGQFQRSLFARLILQDANVILLDEPFTAIDVYTVEHLLKIILGWHQQGKTVLTVCHDLDIVQEYFPRTLLLASQVISWGATSDVLTLDNWQLARKKARMLEGMDEARKVPYGA